MKRFVGLVLVVAALLGCEANPVPKKYGAAQPPGRIVTFDPSVQGLSGAVGEVVYQSGGAAAWVKNGTGNTAWQTFPTAGGGTITTDATLTGAGTVGSPLGINPATVSVMSDVVAIAAGSQTDLTVSGLAGETDGDYEIDFNLIVQGAGTITFYLRPFGASDANMLSDTITSNTNVLQSFPAQNGWVLGYVSSGGVQMRFTGRAFMTSKSGQWRFYESQARETRTNPIYEQDISVGHSSDTTTTVTDVSIHADVASAIRVGSKMKIRKRASVLF